ncbi:high-affinity nickel transporter [Diaporthe amygdali]|uniref:high-affinity nickel transporter n=1 Tax=Phomopsis amygdali TaxID=1214568 RepID=UPI0022FDE70B|nr:high-affinity nickel transporter [Diaporthe amygdali]KAJ0117660.1 high-affinity nickel transporter [Diaporthe amygdali]
MDLRSPVIYLLSTRLASDELRQWGEKISSIARVTQVASEADFIVGKISQKLRAQFELRKLKLPAEEAPPLVAEPHSTPRAKRRKISNTEDYALRSSSFEDSENEKTQDEDTPGKASAWPDSSRKVVRLAWIQDSLSKGSLLDYRDYLVYTALKTPATRATEPHEIVGSRTSQDLPQRDQQVAMASQTSPVRRFKGGQQHHRKAPPLLAQSTTEEKTVANLPPVPNYLHTTYACQRSTVVHPPNEAFIEKLKEVRELRSITGDQVGVRAYSTAIASLSAYPYRLQSPIEVQRLPGCSDKIAFLFAEFENSGELTEIQKAASDQKMAAIRIFTNIFGVSAVTAEEFYRRGWRDLDDIVDYGWKTITRSQQIGVKYYDEFLMKIPRTETASIAETVLQHANRIQEGFQMTIVGGYRRGKSMGGDVDIMLSHPDEKATLDFIDKLVVSLENDKFITHTLTLSSHNSERGQRPTSFKPSSSGGTGFDTLDKALVVWQDPRFDPSAAESSNPNPHRRVDILISPWKTCGCAVLGWTSETTFQRDLRRYCKHEMNLKFDSSGIRSRTYPFDWVDLENGGKGRAATMEEAEKRVFEGLGLVYRSPAERCTG